MVYLPRLVLTETRPSQQREFKPAISGAEQPAALRPRQGRGLGLIPNQPEGVQLMGLSDSIVVPTGSVINHRFT